MFDEEVKQKYVFWRSFSFLGGAVLFVFGINNYLVNNHNLAWIELVLAAVVFVNYLVYFLHKELEFSVEILFLVVIAGLLIMYMTGGLGAKTGVYWYFVFPVSTLFLFNRFKAYVHILLLPVLTLMMLYFSQIGVFALPYSALETRQLLVAYFVVTMLVDTYKKRIDLIQRELKVKNDDLAKNIEERDEQYYKTEKSLLELKQNKSAMLNLLEDSRELEKQLKLEKESVQKKVEERTKELNIEKQRLFTFLSTIPEGVLVIEKNGVPLFANKTAEKIMGFDIKKNSGKNFFELFNVYKAGTDTIYPIEERPSYIALKGKSASVSDIEIERGGIRVPLRVTGAPVYDVNNEVEYGIVVFYDITEEVLLNRSKDEFFSIASHELRTPLTAIRGNSAMIKEMYVEKIADRDFEDMVTDIYDGSVRLIGIVNEFLDLSRLEQGKIDFKKERVSLFDVVVGVVEEMQSLVDEKKGKVVLINSCNRVDILADKNRLHMVLMNLIGNALKFTEHGSVKVITDKVVEGKITVKVVDTGNGIPLANQSLLFRKFQQAGSSLYTRDTSKGTGLGLYVSSLMLAGMGGKIWLEESVEGKGTVFAFSIPLSPTT